VLPRFFSSVLLLKMEWKGPPTNGNPSQSWRYSEEKRTAGAWNGRGDSAWTWPSPKWIGYFNKLKIRNCFILSALKTFQECLVPPSYRCLSVPTVGWSEGFSNFHFCWNLKRAFKWLTGRIKTLGLPFQKESAIESFKRNQNIGISGRIFRWQTGQQNWKLWNDWSLYKHLKWHRIASLRHAADKTDGRQIVVKCGQSFGRFSPLKAVKSRQTMIGFPRKIGWDFYPPVLIS
jgi:hypothetical protein